MNPKLSVIVPTFNRSALLEKMLNSLLNQTVDDNLFEIIVTDNGSTDNTKEIVEKFQVKVPNCVYFFNPKPGLHIVRHLGFANAKANILVYADDDIEAFPTWLEGILESFSDEDVVLVGGKILPKYETIPPFWVLGKWYSLNQLGHCMGELSILDFGDQVKEISPYYVFGCNFSVRKKIINEAGGFHPDGMPFELIHMRGDGETHISNYINGRADYKTIYNPKASVYHCVTTERLSVDYFCKRAFNQGISDSYASIRKYHGIPKKKSASLAKIARYIYKRVFRSRNHLNLIQSRVGLSPIENQIAKAYTTGFNYHQSKVKSDKKLLNWVLRENYFEV